MRHHSASRSCPDQRLGPGAVPALFAREDAAEHPRFEQRRRLAALVRFPDAPERGQDRNLPGDRRARDAAVGALEPPRPRFDVALEHRFTALVEDKVAFHLPPLALTRAHPGRVMPLQPG